MKAKEKESILKFVKQLLNPIEKRLSAIEPELKTSKLTFGEAIEAVKKGHKILWWDFSTRYIYLTEDNELRLYDGYREKSYPWSPNNEELLREDWRIC